MLLWAYKKQLPKVSGVEPELLPNRQLFPEWAFRQPFQPLLAKRRKIKGVQEYGVMVYVCVGGEYFTSH